MSEQKVVKNRRSGGPRTPEAVAQGKAETAAKDARITELRDTKMEDWTAETVSSIRDNVILLRESAALGHDAPTFERASVMLNWLSAALIEALGSEEAVQELIRGSLSTERRPMKFVAPLHVPVKEEVL